MTRALESLFWALVITYVFSGVVGVFTLASIEINRSGVPWYVRYGIGAFLVLWGLIHYMLNRGMK
jgi:hypothetical protein